MATKKSSSKKSTTKKSAAKSSSKKSSAKKSSSKKRSAAKRTLIEPHEGDKRYVRRDPEGKFKTSVSVGRSLSADRRSKSKTVAKKGQGDRGDAKR